MQIFRFIWNETIFEVVIAENERYVQFCRRSVLDTRQKLKCTRLILIIMTYCVCT